MKRVFGKKHIFFLKFTHILISIPLINNSVLFWCLNDRNAEKQFVAETADIEPGTEWERIAKLCDFNPKSSKSSRDVSRMRSIILQLKQTPLTNNA